MHVAYTWKLPASQSDHFNYLNLYMLSELRRCVKVEVAVLGSTSLTVLMVSVDVKQHLTWNIYIYIHTQTHKTKQQQQQQQQHTNRAFETMPNVSIPRTKNTPERHPKQMWPSARKNSIKHWPRAEPIKLIKVRRVLPVIRNQSAKTVPFCDWLKLDNPHHHLRKKRSDDYSTRASHWERN